MKILLDFLPILLFFITFKWGESHVEQAQALANQYLSGLVSGGVVGPKEAPMLLATVVVIVATLLQVIWLKARGKKVDTMLWISLGLVVIMGAATIWFHNENFIKWKPTLLYWIMAATLLVSQLFFRKNWIKALIEQQIQTTDTIWRNLLWMWVGFFVFMGALNIWVASQFTTDVWVNFKLFGGLGLIFVFTLIQGIYLTRHATPLTPSPASNATGENQ